jgi:hypothetical protein
MIIPAPPLVVRKRRGRPGKRIPPSPPVVALALVSVEVEQFDGADGFVRLVFDTTAENPLGDVSAAAAAKWTARYDGVTYEGIELANDTFNSLTLHLLGGPPEAGPDVIGYSNAPSDVGDGLGRQLAAFGGFPL